MYDQASQLRRLVLRNGRELASDRRPGRMIVVVGNRANSGTTTVAFNLAAALVQQGQRTVLVDVDERQPELARMAEAPVRQTLVDVVAGHCDIHEVVLRGPAGLQIVPNARTMEPYGRGFELRLIQQLHSLSNHADVVVVDAGCGDGRCSNLLWREANSLVLVTSPEPIGVMDTYARLKEKFPADHPPLNLPGLFINHAANHAAAVDVHRRIDQSSRRFLGFGLTHLGWSPPNSEIAASMEAKLPLVFTEPTAPLSQACEKFAERLLGEDTEQRRAA